MRSECFNCVHWCAEVVNQDGSPVDSERWAYCEDLRKQTERDDWCNNHKWRKESQK